jgi:hypothetical protein
MKDRNDNEYSASKLIKLSRTELSSVDLHGGSHISDDGRCTVAPTASEDVVGLCRCGSGSYGGDGSERESSDNGEALEEHARRNVVVKRMWVKVSKLGCARAKAMDFSRLFSTTFYTMKPYIWSVLDRMIVNVKELLLAGMKDVSPEWFLNQARQLNLRKDLLYLRSDKLVVNRPA